MRNFKIRTKMLLGFGTMILIIILMTGVALANQRKLSNVALDMYDGPYLNLVDSTALSRGIRTMDISLTNMMVGGYSQEVAQEYHDALAGVQTRFTSLQQKGLLSSTQYSTVNGAMTTMQTAGDQILAALQAKNEATATTQMRDVFDPALEIATAVSDKLAATSDKLAQEARVSAKRTADRVILIQDILFFLSMGYAIYVALRLSRGITYPVNRVAHGVEQIAKGDFEVAFKNTNLDEIGTLSRQLEETVANIRGYIQDISSVLGEISSGNIDLAVSREYVGEFSTIKESLNHIILALNATMQQIRSCCDQVKLGARNLSENAQSLAQGSVRQAAAIEEFEQSLSLVSDLTVKDAESTAQVKSISTVAQDSMQKSDRQMKDMVASMHLINDSSMEIAKIIKIIEDIAFQTNILALNAAVEAARAGAAGKGFAVVADEVRNLAGKSAEAANNTSQMINKAIQAVSGGMSIASETASSLQQVGEHIEQMSTLFSEIDKSKKQQTQAFQRMVSASEEISAVAHANSSASEENSAASEELSSQADILDELVAKFRTKQTQAMEQYSLTD